MFGNSTAVVPVNYGIIANISQRQRVSGRPWARTPTWFAHSSSDYIRLTTRFLKLCIKKIQIWSATKGYYAFSENSFLLWSQQLSELNIDAGFLKSEKEDRKS